MKNLKVEVHRKIKPVSYPYTLDTHLVDSIVGADKNTEELAGECLKYSLEAADSTVKVEPNLYFIVRDDTNFPILFGSPAKSKIIWTETGWIS